MAQVTLITTTQVAEHFHVDPSTVRKWVDKGLITPAMSTPGGHYRFRQSDVDALMSGKATA